MNRPPLDPRALARVALRTSLIYWLVAAAYIALSDRVVEAIVADPAAAARIQTIKGWAFVTLTALLLYFGLQGQLQRWVKEARERRRAEEALRTRMAQIRAILAHQPVAFFACDREGRFTVWEGRTWPAANLPPPEPVGLAVFNTLGDGPAVHSAIQRALQGETVAAEHRSGALSFQVIHTPLNDDHGARVGTAGVVVEITERHKLEAQLLRAQRLESVGRLAGGVAHDVNNILAPVLLGAGLLRHAPLDETQRSLLETMEGSARRGAAIIRQLLVFARGAEGVRGPVMLGSLVNELRTLIRETFPRNLTLRTAPLPEQAVVRGDATQLHQVLLNLCVNARDAMPNGGEIFLRVENVVVDPAAARQWPDAAPGSYVVLEVRDTGTGIPPEHLDKIFDPFFTTKEVGIGTGLGLSTALGIVKSHGGFITVESTPGVGSTFRVHLPADASTVAAAEKQQVGEEPRGQGECILVVDDEQSVRFLVRQTLELAGYRVLEAANGREGVERFRASAEDVKLVVTDLMMPALDGVGLVRELRNSSRHVPVIVMTGVADSPALEQLRQFGVDVQLTKPFTTDALLRAARRCLTTTRPSPQR